MLEFIEAADLDGATSRCRVVGYRRAKPADGQLPVLPPFSTDPAWVQLFRYTDCVLCSGWLFGRSKRGHRL